MDDSGNEKITMFSAVSVPVQAWTSWTRHLRSVAQRSRARWSRARCARVALSPSPEHVEYAGTLLRLAESDLQACRVLADASDIADGAVGFTRSRPSRRGSRRR